VQPLAAASAAAHRSRASITATSTSSPCAQNRLGIADGSCHHRVRLCVLASVRVSAWWCGGASGMASVTGQAPSGYSTPYSHRRIAVRNGPHATALVRHGSAGLVAAHQCTHSGQAALLRSKPPMGNEWAQRRACGVGRAINDCSPQLGLRGQLQTSKQTNKQTNERTNNTDRNRPTHNNDEPDRPQISRHAQKDARTNDPIERLCGDCG
jgi:hypothetical protein